MNFYKKGYFVGGIGFYVLNCFFIMKIFVYEMLVCGNVIYD